LAYRSRAFEAPRPSRRRERQNDDDLENVEAWLNALESMIALLAAQLPAPARCRFVAALRELEATAPELNARLSWSAALNRVRSLIRDDDEKLTPSGTNA
jgi:hypothetical protein